MGGYSRGVNYQDMSYAERASRLRELARVIPDYCYDIRQNILWDIGELERGILPNSNSAESWRSEDIPLLGG